jgi:hypothetical protein
MDRQNGGVSMIFLFGNNQLDDTYMIFLFNHPPIDSSRCSGRSQWYKVT